MEIGAITGEDGRRDDGSQASQSTETPEELFFTDPDHEEMRISEEPEVQNYWEAGLTTESLSTLKTGKVEHSQHEITDQEQKKFSRFRNYSNSWLQGETVEQAGQDQWK